jgi:hypothetical protein
MPFLSRRVLLALAALLGIDGIALFAQYTGRIDYGVRVRDEEVVLFPFDTHAIPFRSGLQLDLVEAGRPRSLPGRPTVGSVVLPPGKPGDPDSNMVEFYGTVIRVGDEYRMWYLCGGDRHEGRKLSWMRSAKIRVAYAVSRDGLDWTKPKLGRGRAADHQGRTAPARGLARPHGAREVRPSSPDPGDLRGHPARGSARLRPLREMRR